MDDYFMDQVIDSFVNDGWYGDGDQSYGYSGFEYDPNYYHHSVRFGYEHETAKAYLLEGRHGKFWCPKTLFRNVKIQGGFITGKLWDGFVPNYIEETQMKPLVAKKKELPKPKKKKKKQKNKEKVLYDEEWARNEGLL